MPACVRDQSGLLLALVLRKVRPGEVEGAVELYDIIACSRGFCCGPGRLVTCGAGEVDGVGGNGACITPSQCDHFVSDKGDAVQ